MIRVIYRWSVEDRARDSFITEWQKLTEWIRDEFDGSYGSTLVADADDDSLLAGIARWQSPDHLRVFRSTAGSLHLPGAQLVSMEVFNEVSHLTVED